MIREAYRDGEAIVGRSGVGHLRGTAPDPGTRVLLLFRFPFRRVGQGEVEDVGHRQGRQPLVEHLALRSHEKEIAGEALRGA